MSKVLPQASQPLQHDSHYIDFFATIKNRLQNAQLKAARAVNQALVQFYWELGKELIEKQKAYKWGEHFLEQFSKDLRAAFPQMQGFSKRNLERMRKFASLYSSIAAQAVPQLPWGHIVLLIQRVTNDTIYDKRMVRPTGP